MKSIIKTIPLFAIAIFYQMTVSCKKEICSDCGTNTNYTSSSLIANAGIDTTYEWPINSIILDGTNSTTENGSIVQYTWSKISGPNVIIATPFNAKTLLLNIEIGVYIFELKIKNNSGETSTANVRLSFILNCKDLKLEVISGQGTITGKGSINNAKGKVYPFVINQKMIITDMNEAGRIENLEVYDQISKTWITDNAARNYLLKGGDEIMKLGNYLGFSYYGYSGDLMFYDVSHNNWTKLTTSILSGYAIGNYDDLIIVAGGLNNYLVPQDQVLMLNASNNAINTLNMSQARSGACITGNKNQIFIAGGYRSLTTRNSIYDDEPLEAEFTTRVDIYDLQLKAWKTTELSQARAGINAISIGDKVIFAGGYYIDTVDKVSVLSNLIEIYDIPTNTWTKSSNSEINYSKIYITKDKFFIVPHAALSGQHKIHMYDPTSNNWSVITKNNSHWEIGSLAVIDNKIIITNGNKAFSNSVPYQSYFASNKLDIYELATNTWSQTELSQSYLGPVVTDGKKAYFIGGYLSETINQIPGCMNCNYKFLPSCSWYELTF